MVALIIILTVLAVFIIAVAVVKHFFSVEGIWNAVHLTLLLGWDLLATFMTYRA